VCGGFHAGGHLFTHVNLSILTVSNHLSFHSLRFSSLFVQIVCTLVDFLNVSVLEHANFANLSASSFP
jgi:hypothetical protein